MTVQELISLSLSDIVPDITLSATNIMVAGLGLFALIYAVRMMPIWLTWLINPDVRG